MGNQKLTPEMIIKMREMRAAMMSVNDVADHFGINKSTASAITTGRVYGNIGGPLTCKERRVSKHKPIRVCVHCWQLREVVKIAKRDDVGEPVLDDNGDRVREFVCEDCLNPPVSDEYIEAQRHAMVGLKSGADLSEVVWSQE